MTQLPFTSPTSIGGRAVLDFPDELPITSRIDDIVARLRDHRVVVVAGETGSGKTTQLPKACLAAGWGKRGMIAHTQPRRLAARTVAARIATEMGVDLGAEVGYALRFSERTSPATVVKVITDGFPLNDIQRFADTHNFRRRHTATPIRTSHGTATRGSSVGTNGF